jgi:hypothetical protein
MAGDRIVFSAAVGLGDLPLRFNPTLMLELVQRRVKRALADLQNVAGHLPDSLRDAQPCIGSSATIFKMSRSKVPCTRSVGLLITLTSVTDNSMPQQGACAQITNVRALLVRIENAAAFTLGQ